MTLVFEPNCIWARLDGRINTSLLKALNSTLSYYEPGYFFSQMFKRRVRKKLTLFGWQNSPEPWDGKRYLMNFETGKFPAGLSNRVLAVLTQQGSVPAVRDERPKPAWLNGTGPRIDANLLRRVVLAPDQLASVRTAVSGIRGCLVLPTGYGKTEVAAAVLALARPARGLFVVNKRTLLTQTAERFEERLGEKIGRLGAGYASIERRVTVATLQTLYHHLHSLKQEGFFSEQQVLIVDEAHTIAPKTGFAVLSEITAPVRIGLSATIKEASRSLAIEAFLGPILEERSLQELIDVGRAAIPTVKMVRVGGVVSEYGDFSSLYRDGIVENKKRNDVIVEAAKRHVESGKQVLVLATLVQHGQRLARSIGEALGVAVPFLYGETPLSVVTEAKRDFERRKVPVLVASTIFDFGQDLPAIQALILAGGQKAPLRTIQRMGRAMRFKRTGENTVEILDFLDMGHRKLQKHSETRKRTYEMKGFKPKVFGSVAEALGS